MANPSVSIDYDPDRLILQVGDLNQRASHHAAPLSAGIEEFDIYAEQGADPVIRIAREETQNGVIRVILYAMDRVFVAAMERIARRIHKVLPDWPPAEDNYTARSILEAGFFYGQRVNDEFYRVEAILNGHPEHYNEQVLLLGRYCADRYDSAGTIEYRVTSKRNSEAGRLRADTPLEEFLEGRRGKMVARMAYRPGSCSGVIMAANPDLHIRVRWPGPEFSLRVRAPKVGAVLIMQDLLIAWRATMQRLEHEQVAAYGYSELRQRMGF